MFFGLIFDLLTVQLWLILFKVFLMETALPITKLPFIPAHYFKFDEIEDGILTNIPVKALIQYLKCFLCKGYLIDATAIVECLHTFCKSCIVKYFQIHNQCPVCHVKVHETCPFASLQTDRTIQDLLYKIFPNISKDEEQRRIEFYRTHGALPRNAESVIFREGRKFQKHITSVLYDIQPPSDGHAYYCDTLVAFLLEGIVPLEKVNSELKGSSTLNDCQDISIKKYIRCPERSQICHLISIIKQSFLKPLIAIDVKVYLGGEKLKTHITIKQVAIMGLLSEDEEICINKDYFKLKFEV